MTNETLKSKVTARIAKYNPNGAKEMVDKYFQEAVNCGWSTPAKVAEAIVTFNAM